MCGRRVLAQYVSIFAAYDRLTFVLMSSHVSLAYPAAATAYPMLCENVPPSLPVMTRPAPSRSSRAATSKSSSIPEEFPYTTYARPIPSLAPGAPITMSPKPSPLKSVGVRHVGERHSMPTFCPRVCDVGTVCHWNPPPAIDFATRTATKSCPGNVEHEGVSAYSSTRNFNKQRLRYWPQIRKIDQETHTYQRWVLYNNDLFSTVVTKHWSKKLSLDPNDVS